jgi:hypothetical protein
VLVASPIRGVAYCGDGCRPTCLGGAAPDITTSENLEQLVKTLRRGGVDFALADVRQSVRDTARRTGLLEAIGEDHLFHTLDEAVDAMESRVALA